MTDDARLRSALTALAEAEPAQPVLVDLRLLEQARRTSGRRRAAGAAVAFAGAAFLVAQTDLVDLGGGRPSTAVVAAQPGDPQLSRVATVRCTDTGTLVDPVRIATSADGVHLNVANETSDTGTYLTYGSGGDLAPPSPTEQVRTFPPGAYEISCAHSPDMDADDAVTLTVVDPDGFYEEVDPEAVLGCAFTGTADGPTTEGSTGRQAAEAWVAAHAPGGTLTPAAGYREDPQRWYLLDSPTERATLQVWHTDQGSFTAGIGEVC